VTRGVELGIHLVPGLDNDDAVAEALGNLAPYSLAQERHQTFEWQVLRVQEPSGGHHYRLVLRRPNSLTRFGLRKALIGSLNQWAVKTPQALSSALEDAVRSGLRVVPLREVDQEVDYWADEFWVWWGLLPRR
jgi:hypothetical protein